MAASEKTERATPKKRGEARDKGQVARSTELNGAVVLLAGLLALSAFGPALMRSLEEATTSVLELGAHPQIVSAAGLPAVLRDVGTHVGLAFAPLIACCAVGGVVINVLQVGLKPAKQALKPDLRRLDPMKGMKNLLSPNSAVEAAKGLFKVLIVGGVVCLALFPKLDEMAGLVGLAPGDLLGTAAGGALHIAQRAAAAYLVIAFADLLWQRRRFEKSLRMDKQEIKEELKQQDLPREVRTALRRKAVEAARRRMMDDVPTADVVVTNPTHFSVALRYDGANVAPVVVAKGQDHVALRIREVAREAGVAVVPDPPLARSLHASVEIGQMIPEELYQAVAQLLAYVYRVAGRRAALGAAA
jgi:flagellar biosynthesis protein FlhB